MKKEPSFIKKGSENIKFKKFSIVDFIVYPMQKYN